MGAKIGKQKTPKSTNNMDVHNEEPTILNSDSTSDSDYTSMTSDAEFVRPRAEQPPIVIAVTSRELRVNPSDFIQYQSMPAPNPAKGTFVYVNVQGSVYSDTCKVFGLSEEETRFVNSHFPGNTNLVAGGIKIGAPPAVVLNILGQLKYFVVSSTGQIEPVWTLTREVL